MGTGYFMLQNHSFSFAYNYFEPLMLWLAAGRSEPSWWAEDFLRIHQRHPKISKAFTE